MLGAGASRQKGGQASMSSHMQAGRQAGSRRSGSRQHHMQVQTFRLPAGNPTATYLAFQSGERMGLGWRVGTGGVGWGGMGGRGGEISEGGGGAVQGWGKGRRGCGSGVGGRGRENSTPVEKQRDPQIRSHLQLSFGRGEALELSETTVRISGRNQHMSATDTTICIWPFRFWRRHRMSASHAAAGLWIFLF